MPVNGQQIAAFADTHLRRIPLDVSPRHLAGPGDGRRVTHGLAAAGWQRTSDVLSPEIILSSPDHRYSLQFDPQSATSTWWTLRAGPAGDELGWHATFAELVPAEVLAAMTDALLAAPHPTGESDLFRTLRSANWPTDPENTAHSPDGMCHVEHRFNDGHLTRFWTVDVYAPGQDTPWGRRLWHASFTGSTPLHLVNAFVAALADPAPLQRGMFDRTANHSAVRQPSQLTPQQVVAAHTGRLDAIRAQARAARRQHPGPRPTALPPPAPIAAPRR
ncbi:DUF317 domain-containing protein [Streptomyces sp. NPDC091280]|uniref:DUF317 domain-containing protein n=1 Tax=Streptomyces sp. NPDC091280 TaxID=3365984 RepID=UPI00380D1E56